jgi:hypothetical protein
LFSTLSDLGATILAGGRELQDSDGLSVQVDPEYAVDGREHHLVDEATYCLAGLVLLGTGGERLLQAIYTFPVDVGHIVS